MPETRRKKVIGKDVTFPGNALSTTIKYILCVTCIIKIKLGNLNKENNMTAKYYHANNKMTTS